MSLFGAFGAGCAAISSSTAAIGTSLDRVKCGKIFMARILRESSFSTGVALSSSSSSFYYVPMRGGWGGDYDSLRNVVFLLLRRHLGFYSLKDTPPYTQETACSTTRNKRCLQDLAERPI